MHPFTMCVHHKLVGEEAASAQTLREANFDYSLLQSIVPGIEREHAHASDSDNDDEEGAQAALIGKGRITSAYLYNLGPVTAERAYNIVRARALNKEMAAAAAKDKRDAREAAAREVHEQLMQVANALVVMNKAQIRALCVNE